MTYNSTSKRVLSLSEFCRDYAVSRTVAYELINSGRLRTFKIGAKRVVPSDAAEEWLSSMTAV